jgi:hypothetical protein
MAIVLKSANDFSSEIAFIISVAEVLDIVYLKRKFIKILEDIPLLSVQLK